MRRTFAFAAATLLAAGAVAAATEPWTAAGSPPSVPVERQSTVWHEDPNAAWREAFAADKPMFLVVSSRKCPACDTLKAGVLASPEFRGWVESRFVPAVILAEDHPHVVAKLGVRGYPTTVVVAPKLGVVHSALGVFNASDFQQKLALAEASAGTTAR
ncbi:MAG TPA: thioredoxin fold domain-containing protein [Pirellulaceae bacterium]|jgi:hypothetical protein|nr:thioredoxin fold domain-containing protein [Pirellulaceae bacterium]